MDVNASLGVGEQAAAQQRQLFKANFRGKTRRHAARRRRAPPVPTPAQPSQPGGHPCSPHTTVLEHCSAGAALALQRQLCCWTASAVHWWAKPWALLPPPHTASRTICWSFFTRASTDMSTNCLVGLGGWLGRWVGGRRGRGRATSLQLPPLACTALAVQSGAPARRPTLHTHNTHAPCRPWTG